MLINLEFSFAYNTTHTKNQWSQGERNDSSFGKQRMSFCSHPNSKIEIIILLGASHYRLYFTYFN